MGETSAQQWKPAIFGTAFGLILVLSLVYSLHPIRCLLLSVWAGGAGITAWYIWKHCDRIYKTQWFDPTKQANPRKAQLAEVEEVIDVEPLKYMKLPRYPTEVSVRDFVALVILGVFFVSTLRLIFLFNLGGLDPTDIASWALPAGMLALMGTVLTVFYHVRLTARTQNRAEWIGSIRHKMAALISLRDTRSDPDKAQLPDVDKRITELELMLNPGEALHRTFLALIRTLHEIDDNEFDEETRSQLGGTFAEDVSADRLKARCIRVSNVILKYEWERVKHAE